MATIEEINKSKRSPAIEGIEVSMGGYMWTIPALTFRHIGTLQKDILKAQTSGPDGKADLEKLYEANLQGILWALQRNYPGLEMEQLLDLVDAGNYIQVLGAMAGASGLSLGNDQTGILSSLSTLTA